MSKKPMQYIDIPNEDPKRLDVVFSQIFSISRTQAQKKIRDMRLFVNGKEATPHTLVSSKDEVKSEDSLVQEKASDSPTASHQLHVLYEDDDVLVVVKPAGMVMHKINEHDTQLTLVDLAIAHAPQIAQVGDNTLRPGVVHRLDRQASGVVVFAKNPQAFSHLKQQFQGRQTIKKYTVLVDGAVADTYGSITFPIARSQARGRMAARPHSQEGKEAITHYHVLQRYTSSTLLDVHIETGRTHQIRAHMFAIGHPVIGDELYTSKRILSKILKGTATLGRLFLHARELTLTLPNGEVRTFTAELPPELADYLANRRPAHDTDNPNSPAARR